jgi:hypothetical protein
LITLSYQENGWPLWDGRQTSLTNPVDKTKKIF